MRIISGKYKGRRLTAPKKLPIRPTTDFAKEALFNILNNYYDFTNLSVLDLFAGMGTISFEFGSRGAESITAVDSHVGCVRYIQEITQLLSLPITVVKSDVFRFLKSFRTAQNIVFADPPYAFTPAQLKELHTLICTQQLVAAEGMFILEHSKHTDISTLPYFTFSKRYGNTVFSFFEPEEKGSVDSK